MQRFVRQTRAALTIGLHSMHAHPRHALLIMSGLLIAGFTLMVILTIPAGLDRIAARTGRADVAVVLASSRMDESSGNIRPELVARIGSLPGVAHAADGTPLVAAQFVVHAHLARRDARPGTTLLRGVSPATYAVTGTSLRFVNGEPPAAGLPQCAAGRVAASTLRNIMPGDMLDFRAVSWKVVGTFAAGDGLWEGELWTDLDSLRAAYNAQGQTTTVWVRLTSPSAFSVFHKAMDADPRLAGFPAVRQPRFYARRVAFLAEFAAMAALVIAITLGGSAVLAANSAVALALRARRRELAILRAIGFSNAALGTALILEVLFLASICAVAVTILGLLMLNGRAIDSATGSESIRFALAVTPWVACKLLAYCILLGLLGALVPARNVLTAPLVRALARE